MTVVSTSIEQFFFRRVSATGFGVMRMGFGILVFVWMTMHLPEVVHQYTNEGYMHLSLGHLLFRIHNRFSLLDYVTEPMHVMLVYDLLLLAALSTAIGWKPRLSVIATTLLLFSFHERNLFPLGGGDTVLRSIGFLLMIAPELRACSIERLYAHWKHFKNNKTLAPPLTMPIWPYRLLLWQVIVIYIASGWEKASGDMWWTGTAVAAAYHHTHFARWSKPVMDILSALSPYIGYATIIFEFAWLLILVPMPKGHDFIPYVRAGTTKRLLLLMGVIFHLGIYLTMSVGVFVPAMLLAYIGLLLDDDFDAMRNFLNPRRKITTNDKLPVRTDIHPGGQTTNSIYVFYDSHCGLCTRSVLFLTLLDALHRLQLVYYHDEKLRKDVAPELRFEDLDRSMHIKFPDGRVEKGFDAFRALSWHLPVLWPLAPFLYIPGIAPIGRWMYHRIAARRASCTHKNCAL